MIFSCFSAQISKIIFKLIDKIHGEFCSIRVLVGYFSLSSIDGCSFSNLDHKCLKWILDIVTSKNHLAGSFNVDGKNVGVSRENWILFRSRKEEDRCLDFLPGSVFFPVLSSFLIKFYFLVKK